MRTRRNKMKQIVSFVLVACMLVVYSGILPDSVQTAVAQGADKTRGNSKGYIISVEVDNENITAKFNKQPTGGKPKVSDFTIGRQVKGGAVEVIAPTSFVWHPSTKVAEFAVPSLTAGSSTLSVVYSVSFRTDDFVAAPAFVIPATQGTIELVEDGLARAVVIVAEEDLVPQAGENIEGWKPLSKPEKISLSREQKVSGAFSLYLNKDYPEAVGLGVESGFMEITPDEQYTASSKVYRESGGVALIYIRFYDEDKQRIGNHAAGGGTIGQWSDLSITRAAPAEAVYATIVLYADSAGQRSLYYDDITLKKQDVSSLLVSNADFEQVVYKPATELVNYVEKSTGVRLSIITEDNLRDNPGLYDDYNHIYVGASVRSKYPAIDNDLAELDKDGFIIRNEGNSVAIIGPSGWGTEFGVYEFLERYVGVRWLMPGPDGEDVPELVELIIPEEEISDEPAFMSRRLSPMTTPTRIGQLPYDWAIYNRMHTRLEGFGHNLWSLFLPSKFGVTNPEFYPLRDGQRYIPPDNVTVAWQPCFSEPRTIQVAVDGILDYFSKNPDADSYSLAVNDTGGYCEQEPGHPANSNQINSIGLPDMSDVYYAWVNEVVEEVLEVYPDKWFGVLAYQNVMDPPSFALHPRVVPHITKDRMTWIDEDIREAGELQMDQWGAVAENIAWYDYHYGTPYMIPRMYSGLMADLYQYSQQNGVIAHVSELYPNWGEGPKPWISAKLQWNPDQDVEELQQEWYERAVGVAAAPDLAAYYEHWEEFWTERVIHSSWFKPRKHTTYLPFNMANYLALVSDEEIAYSRTLLESVVAKAVTAPQKARAQKLLQAFEYYEASVLSYSRQVAVPENVNQALDLLDETIMNLQAKLDLAKKRMTLIAQFAGNPVLQHPIGPQNYGDLKWTGWDPHTFWRLADYIRQEQKDGPVREQVVLLAAQTNDEMAAEYARLLLVAASGNTANLNPSFESGTTTADIWTSSIVRYGEFKRVEGGGELAYSGDASIYIHNFYYGKLSQIVASEPGLKVLRLRYHVSPDTESVGNIYLTLNYLDNENKVLYTENSISEHFVNETGDWSEISMLVDGPDSVNSTEVAAVQMVVTINGFHEGGTLYLDDFEFFQ